MDLSMQARTRSNQPCAACRLLRRRCSSSCLLAPYFPIDDTDSFAQVHKVFGASNVIKMLQAVDESRREDAVKSMVYEAKARLRDPIYGCAGVIFCLQKHLKDLEIQLQSTKAQFLESQAQRDQLLKVLAESNHFDPFAQFNNLISDRYNLVSDDNTLGCNPYEYSSDFSGSQEIQGLYDQHGQTSYST
ncbi:LOB domain-containing protein 12-like protein [Cinnamomum micranthum f. kanehirae]|uniref:LOB domain-containing protein 12-like protein n=1 Tax=Cinnamomum micranthum f. kanehirae TaxID=337451 RepID=A0A443Q082_9MAGN|nr:LOB domain-containing protein 12-like protein [Cinnamomum micranthum f. kanehirae]